jgi:hypothetical protein
MRKYRRVAGKILMRYIYAGFLFKGDGPIRIVTGYSI